MRRRRSSTASVARGRGCRRAGEGRRRAVPGARRRRHDPARAAALRGHAACRCSRSTSARSASWRRSSRRTSRTASAVRSTATSSCCGCRRSCSTGYGRLGVGGGGSFAIEVRALGGDQRRGDPSQGRRARGGAGVCDRRTGGRERALRRPRGGHAGGVDRLQPRQRRPGDGVGRGGLRGVVHRAALDDGARAGGRAGRSADDLQPLARAAGRGGGRASGRRDRSRRARSRRSFVNDVGTIAQLPGSSFYRRLREKFGRLAS